MPKIHPTAIVDPLADLAEDVEVGPWCVITGPVKIGAGTRLIGNAYLNGNVTLGEGNLIYPFATLGLAPQDLRFDATKTVSAGVKLGDKNVIREGVTIHAATKETPTSAGNGNYLMAYCHLGHDVKLGDDVIMANVAMLAGHVQVQSKAFVGGTAVVHQFCRLGRLCMVGGGLRIIQDVPPFCTAHGNEGIGSLNLIGLRRAGLRAHIRPLQEAFNLLYRRGHIRSNAAKQIEQELGSDPLCLELAQFVLTTKRGVTGYVRSRELNRGEAEAGEA